MHIVGNTAQLRILASLHLSSVGIAILAVVLGTITPLAAAGGGTGAPDSLLPPLEHPGAVTSSFGEYRPGHYHGGLDFSTGQRTGIPVRAPGDGWVYRVRASGVGYGRAVYFRLLDGRTTVFAHLSRFAPGIAEPVERRQDDAGEYEIDFQPDPGAISFRRGEVLGYTGASGAGPAHLHAEIRVGESASVAVNPQAHGWGLSDTEAPEVRRVRVAPAAPGVRVDGGTAPVVLAFKSSEPIPRASITGPIRLWVEVRDTSRPEGSRLAPYRVEAALDDRPYSEVVLGRFDWNWPAEVERTFLESRARMKGERWVALTPLSRTRQRIHRRFDAGGALGERLADGLHVLRITAADYVGNTTARSLELSLDRGDTTSVLADTGPFRPGLASRGSYLELTTTHGGAPRVVDSRGEVAPWRWAELSAAMGSVFQQGRPDPAERPGLWHITASAGDLEAAAIWMPAGDMDSPEVFFYGDLELRLAPTAVYEDLWISVARDGVVDSGNETELEPVGSLYRLGPWAEPLREPLLVILAPPPDSDTAGVGVYSRRGEEWDYEGAETASGSRMATRLMNLEDVALFRDATAPRILAVYPDRDTTAATVQLGAEILDTGSGVHWSTLALKLDRKKLIAEWDADERFLRAHLRNPLTPGNHTLRVEAADRAGNRSEREIDFYVR